MLSKVAPWDGTGSDTAVRWLRFVIALLMVGIFVFFVVQTYHWQIVSDTSVMHYIRLLLDNGLKPYSQITDNNMPGAYLVEGWGMDLFGYGDIGWRLYEYVSLLILTAAMVVIARPYDWLAGLYGAGMFLALHGADGPANLAEREQVILVLLMVGCAALFSAVRQKIPWFCVIFGFTGALASCIKPQFLPLCFLVLVVALVVLRKKGASPVSYFAWSSGGFVLATALVLAFLVRHHAVGDFISVLRKVTPAYAGLARSSTRELIYTIKEQISPIVVLLAAVLTVSAWRFGEFWNWERWVLFAACCAGLFSYFLQGKGYPYHEYIFLGFYFLILGLELTSGMRRAGWPKVLAVAVLILSVSVLPKEVRHTVNYTTGTALVPRLEQDLLELGNRDQLNKQVDCMDIAHGCLSALYHLGIIGPTGRTGDLMLFADGKGPVIDEARSDYWALERERPTNVIVLTTHWFGHFPSFAKLGNWPEFANYLQSNFTEVTERQFPAALKHPKPSDAPNAYRIYVRNGSPFLAHAEVAGLSVSR